MVETKELIISAKLVEDLHALVKATKNKKVSPLRLQNLREKVKEEIASIQQRLPGKYRRLVWTDPNQIQELADYLQPFALETIKDTELDIEQESSNTLEAEKLHSLVAASKDNRPELKPTKNLQDILKNYREQTKTFALQNQRQLALENATATDKPLTTEEIVKEGRAFEQKLVDDFIESIDASGPEVQSDPRLERARPVLERVAHRAMRRHQSTDAIVHQIVSDVEKLREEKVIDLPEPDGDKIQAFIKDDLGDTLGASLIESGIYKESLAEATEEFTNNPRAYQELISDYLTRSNIDPARAATISKELQNAVVVHNLTATSLDSPKFQEIVQGILDKNQVTLSSQVLLDITDTSLLFSEANAANPIYDQLSHVSLFHPQTTSQTLFETGADFNVLHQLILDRPQNASTHLSFIDSWFSDNNLNTTYFNNINHSIHYFYTPQSTSFPAFYDTFAYSPSFSYFPSYSTGLNTSTNYSYSLGQPSIKTPASGVPFLDQAISGINPLDTALEGGLPQLPTASPGVLSNAINVLKASRLGTFAGGTFFPSGLTAALPWILCALVIIGLILYFSRVNGHNRMQMTYVIPAAAEGVGMMYKCDPNQQSCPTPKCEGDCKWPVDCGCITQGPFAGTHSTNKLDAIDIWMEGKCQRGAVGVYYNRPHPGQILFAMGGYPNSQEDGTRGNYGNQVHIRVLDPAGPYILLYGHMAQDSVTVTQGQTIEPNTLIGIAAESGMGLYHLHFEVRGSGGSIRDILPPEAQKIKDNCSSLASCGNICL